MAFSYLRSFLDAVSGKAEQQRRVQSGEAAALAAENELGGLPEVSPDEAAFLDIDDPFREAVVESTRNEQAQPADLREGFLKYGRWLFATRSHHVNACQYSERLKQLIVSYQRGDQWRYTPIDPVLAAKFADDLLGGSPGTDVWDYLRLRPSEGAKTMREHRPGITAVRMK